MSYETFTASAESGLPVQLFLFRYGSEAGEIYAYTDHDEELTVASVTYSPVPIERDSISSDGTLDKASLKITTDVGTDVAELFRVYPPSTVVSLVIAEGHIGDPDEEFLVTWAGRVTAAGRNKGELTLTGEPVSTSLRRPGLRRHYQRGCMHQLYGPQCQASKVAGTGPDTLVTAISGASVTLASGWNGAHEASKFLGGMVEWETDGGSIARRTILRVTGSTLLLSGIPNGLIVTDTVNAVLGCNHQALASQGGDCQGLHDNILNYGGCLWIPTRNPIGSYNNYY